MKKIIVSVAVLLAVSVRGADDALAFLRGTGFFDSVTVSSTNLTLKFLPDWRMLVRQKGDVVSRLPEFGETISLIPDVETRLSDGHHVFFTFIPVEYRQKQRGFKFLHVFNAYSFGRGITTNNIGYIALSDTPVEVGEDDVEMILVNGEWKAYEKSRPAPKEEGASAPPPPPEPVPPPAREQPPEPTVGTPPQPAPADAPASVAENEQSGEKSNASPLWLYALIPLFLLAIFYFLRRKKTLATNH